MKHKQALFIPPPPLSQFSLSSYESLVNPFCSFSFHLFYLFFFLSLSLISSLRSCSQQTAAQCLAEPAFHSLVRSTSHLVRWSLSHSHRHWQHSLELTSTSTPTPTPTVGGWGFADCLLFVRSTVCACVCLSICECVCLRVCVFVCAYLWQRWV